MELLDEQQQKLQRCIDETTKEKDYLGKVNDRSLEIWNINPKSGKIEIVKYASVLKTIEQMLDHHAAFKFQLEEYFKGIDRHNSTISQLQTNDEAIMKKIEAQEQDSQKSISSCLRQREALQNLLAIDDFGFYRLRDDFLALVSELNDRFQEKIYQCTVPGSLHIYVIKEDAFVWARSFSLITGRAYKANSSDLLAASHLKLAFYDAMGVGVEIQLALKPGGRQKWFMDFPENNDELLERLLDNLQSTEHETARGTLSKLLRLSREDVPEFFISHAPEARTMQQYYQCFRKQENIHHGLVRIPEAYSMNNFYDHEEDRKRQEEIRRDIRNCHKKIKDILDIIGNMFEDFAKVWEKKKKFLATVYPQARNIIAAEELEQRVAKNIVK